MRQVPSGASGGRGVNGAPNFALPPDAFLGAIAKARTAAYVSSNQNAFTSLTACFTTRAHFPP
ncbi:MAG: hypothetical protein L0271_22550, partial [Gemmatimonadetes bacterium]|nr:hypothetical protein [Gemmatimonadota bacterium]